MISQILSQIVIVYGTLIYFGYITVFLLLLKMGTRIKRKRGEVLLSDGYQYHKHKVYANQTIIWFCSQRRKLKCTGSVTVTAKVRSSSTATFFTFAFIALLCHIKISGILRIRTREGSVKSCPINLNGIWYMGSIG